MKHGQNHFFLVPARKPGNLGVRITLNPGSYFRGRFFHIEPQRAPRGTSSTRFQALFGSQSRQKHACGAADEEFQTQGGWFESGGCLCGAGWPPHACGVAIYAGFA